MSRSMIRSLGVLSLSYVVYLFVFPLTSYSDDVTLATQNASAYFMSIVTIGLYLVLYYATQEEVTGKNIVIGTIIDKGITPEHTEYINVAYPTGDGPMSTHLLPRPEMHWIKVQEDGTKRIVTFNFRQDPNLDIGQTYIGQR